VIRKEGNGQRPWKADTRDHTGRRIQRSFRTKADAEKWERDEIDKAARARAGLQIEQGPITYRELVELWKAAFPPSNWRVSMLSYGVEKWGDTRVRMLQPQGIGAWLHGLPYSEKTKVHILESMRQVLNAGVDWGYLSRSPARQGAFKAPSRKRVREIRPFESWDEVLAVAGELLGNESPLVRFVCSTGLTSPGEWIDATWGDIDLKGRTMVVHGTKTENRRRTIPLSQTAMDALDDLPRGFSRVRLFQSRTKQRFDYYNFRKTYWPLALDNAGLERRTPNEMRHTFAVLALQSGVPIDAVSDLLGHGSIEITYRYYRKWTKTMSLNARDLLDTWAAKPASDDQPGDF
jgi:integrase